MITQPAVLAILVGAVVTLLAALAAAVVGIQVLRRWDLSSGARAQVLLERRTVLASSALTLGLAVELASLVLLVFTLDQLAVHFTGAMCAVGTLAAGPWGWWLLGAKLAMVVLAGTWLNLDSLDSLGHDFPLLRAKAALALVLAPLALAELALAVTFFGGMDPRIGVSCCSQVFAAGAPGGAASLAAAPPGPVLVALGVSAATALVTGLASLRWARMAWAYAAASLVLAATSLLAVVAAVAPWVYELPHHHCPFCLLQRGHGAVGYPLYLLLLAGLILGAVQGPARLVAHRPSLRRHLPAWSRTRILAALACQAGMLVLMAVLATRSNLRLLGPS